jgi:hypothetical protein
LNLLLRLRGDIWAFNLDRQTCSELGRVLIINDPSAREVAAAEELRTSSEPWERQARNARVEREAAAEAWQHERAQLVADADTRVRNARREHEAAAETWQVRPG